MTEKEEEIESVEQTIEYLKSRIKRENHKENFVGAEQCEHELAIEQMKLYDLQDENKKDN